MTFPADILLSHPHDHKRSDFKNVMAVQKKFNQTAFKWTPAVPATWASEPWPPELAAQFVTEFNHAFDQDLKALNWGL